MKFIIIDAIQRQTRIENHETLEDAEKVAGLTPDKVDHGVLTGGTGYVVAEFSLFAPKALQHYACYGRLLIAGNAVVYGFDKDGDTCDVFEFVAAGVSFMASAEVVEKLIGLNLIDRPGISVNGEMVWRWPQPAPEWAVCDD